MVLPIGGLLTQYTITGYDASAHLSEETQEAADTAAKGMWRSIFYSAIGGWILLLAVPLRRAGPSEGHGGRRWRGHDLLPGADVPSGGARCCSISTAGQFFCTMACMTSCSRMLFAFSRDGAVPGHKHWSRLSANRVPVAGVILTAVIGIILTSPALIPVDINGAPVPIAFYAVVSIGVIGLYWCFAIPIWHRWRTGREVQAGRLEPGDQVQVAERHRPHRRRARARSWPSCPRRTSGCRGESGFAMKYVNYTIIVVPVAMIALWVYWHLSVKKWFTGPRQTINMTDEELAKGI